LSAGAKKNVDGSNLFEFPIFATENGKNNCIIFGTVTKKHQDNQT
jgi:hypothetical protein